jgi:hypothetical protein
MRKVSNMNLRGRSSSYCFLNEAAAIVLEHKLATTPEDRDGDYSVGCRAAPDGRGARSSCIISSQIKARHPRAWSCLTGRRCRARFTGQTIREGSLAGSHKPDKTSGGNNSNP